LWQSGKETASSQADWALEHTCAGRVVSALTFIVVVLCLGLWITVFLLLKDQLFTQTLTGNALTNLTCIVFFGGLVVALFVGALMGNFLRRAFWKMLVRRYK
jgi:fumarate reductase subunit D